MKLPTRHKNFPTELEGVNYVRGLFERANCIFRETHREHDYGHDATIGLVKGTTVLPKEIAVQIKSGDSYVSKDECYFSTTEQHRNYWREHPLTTYGIVYDPNEKTAYWQNLKELPHEFRFAKGSKTVKFKKHTLNKISEACFEKIFLAKLCGETPNLEEQEAIDWSKSDDPDLQYVGLLVLLRHFSDKMSTWVHFLDLYENRKLDNIAPYLIYILAHLNSHCDIHFSKKNGWILSQDTTDLKDRIAKQGPSGVKKLLGIVDEGGFERGYVGQSCAAVIKLIPNYQQILFGLLRDSRQCENLRFKAMCLLFHFFHINEDQLNELIEETGIDYYSTPSK